MARKSLIAGLLVALLFARSDTRVFAVDIEDLQADVKRIRDEIKRQDDPKTAPVSVIDEKIFEQYGDNT